MSRSDVILERLMSLHPKVIDLSLDRMHRILAALGNPQHNIPPVIHVAGTNGKGSTQAMIRAGLEAAGKTVHAYTSPHLAWFHERIRLAGELISEDMLADILEECEQANGGEPITFFEITTAAAFVAFSRVPADYTLLEVGLGGRLDATNVVDHPRLTVITPISIDHTQYLGDTLEAITGEKAGILKQGAPGIIAPQLAAARQVIEDRAQHLSAPLKIARQDWDARREGDALIYHDEQGLMDLPLPVLAGPHQIENAGTAIAALRALGFGRIEAKAAITEAEWPARMQRLQRGPLVDAAAGCELWLDGGHNPAGGKAVAATLASLPKRPTHLVCGMLNTKDVVGYMRPLAEVADDLIAISIPGEPNTLSAEETAQAATEAGLRARTASDAAEAVNRIASEHPGSRILICGSLYLAGRILRENS